MKALVLGGSVFVGKHTVDALLAGGHEVAVLNRGRTPTALPDDVERLVADRTDIDQLRAALDGRDWDAVFDVSGFVMAAGGSDIEGLLDLLDGHVGHYVYVSSIMAYDQSLGGIFPWTEDLPTNPDGAGSYGGFKAVAEAGMLARHRATGFPATIVRPAAIYGPDNNIFDMELPMFLRLLGSSADPGAPRRPRRRVLRPRRRPVRGDGVDGRRPGRRRRGVQHQRRVGHREPLRRRPRRRRRRGARRRVPARRDARRAARRRCSPTSSACATTPWRASRRPGSDSASRAATTCARVTTTPTTGSGATGYADVDGPMVDPMWRASWDFDAEAAVAEQVRGA